MENKFFTTMEEAREFIKKDGMNLKYITNWLSLLPCSESEEDAKRKYIELALLAVENANPIFVNLPNQHHPLEYIDSSVSNEDYEKIAMAAVIGNPCALQFVKSFRVDFSQDNNLTINDSLLKSFDLDENNELSGYRQIALEAIRQNELTLEFASDKIKNDKEIVLEAVKRFGCMLRYASDELKNDKEVVLESIMNILFAFRHASDELKNDNDFILALINLENQDIDEFLRLLIEIKGELYTQLNFLESELDKLKSFKDGLNYNDEQAVLLDKINQKKNLLIFLEKKQAKLNIINNLKNMTKEQVINLIRDTSSFVTENEYENYTSFNTRIGSYDAVDGKVYFLTDDIDKFDIIDLLSKKVRCFIVSDTLENINGFATEHLTRKKSKKISRKIKRKVPSEKKDNLLMKAFKSLVNFYMEPIERENISVIDAKKTK